MPWRHTQVANLVWQELRRWWMSPTTWLLMATLYFVEAFLFFLFVDAFVTQLQPRNLVSSHPVGMTDAVIVPFYWWTGVLLVVFIPAWSMRWIGEDYQHKTWALLRLAPLSSLQILTVKFVAASLALFLLLAGFTLMPLSLLPEVKLDLGQLFSAVLGTFLLGETFLAAGLWCATLSRQPLQGALLAYAGLLLSVLLYLAANLPGFSSELFYYLTPFNHFKPWLEGLLDTRDLGYFLLSIALFFLLAWRRLKQDKETPQ